MAILLENAIVITMDDRGSVLHRQKILIDNGVIAGIGENVDTSGLSFQQRIDCSGKIVMPGLVNAHSHLTEILQRSLRDNMRMEIWLRHRLLTEEVARLSPAEIQAASQLACAEMLKSGVTAVVDHFAAREGLTAEKMLAVLTAFEKTGIRGMLTPSLRDQDWVKLLRPKYSRRRVHHADMRYAWREEILEILKDISKSSQFSGLMLGPSNVLSCSDLLLREIVETAEKYDLGIHAHFLETRLERWAAQKLWKGQLCQRLKKLGILSPRLSLAHAVWIEEREMDLLASLGVSVVHNPASNLKLGSGIAPVVQLKKRGVNVALGSDGGDTSDTYSIFDQMRLAAFLSRLTVQDANHWLVAADTLRMATINGATAVPAWRGRIGRIKTGYHADLVILKPYIGLRPLNNVIHQLVFCENGQSVETVLVGGQIVVKEGRLTRVNEDKVAQEVEQIAKRMRRIYGRIRKRCDQEAAVVKKLYAQAL